MFDISSAHMALAPGNRTNSYATFRLLAVVLTALVIVVHEYLPPKVVQLYPVPEQQSWVYGPDRQGAPTTDWIDLERTHLWCNFAPGDPYACGWQANLGPDRTTGLDLSDIDGFNVHLYYKGDSPRLRLYLRDFDPAFSDINRFDVSSKVMATAIRTSDLNKPAYIRLSEFSVAEWWITEFDIGREHAAPSYNNVIVFGFEFITHSENEIRVEKIEAVGQWIHKEALYFGIISLWMSWIVLEVLIRFYLIHKKSVADARRIERLAREYKRLELEKKEFEELSTTDALTGIMNRAGIQQVLQRLYEDGIEGDEVGLLLFDIDHFKKINDQFGHDVGDQVLSEVAAIIKDSIRQSDVFGRWGGEEFILLCPKMPESNLKAFADKLRQVIEQHAFTAPAQTLRATVSVGATTVGAQEEFQVAFKRADVALYQAKNNGRNQVRLQVRLAQA